MAKLRRPGTAPSRETQHPEHPAALLPTAYWPLTTGVEGGFAATFRPIERLLATTACESASTIMVNRQKPMSTSFFVIARGPLRRAPQWCPRSRIPSRGRGSSRQTADERSTIESHPFGRGSHAGSSPGPGLGASHVRPHRAKTRSDLDSILCFVSLLEGRLREVSSREAARASSSTSGRDRASRLGRGPRRPGPSRAPPSPRPARGDAGARGARARRGLR